MNEKLLQPFFRAYPSSSQTEFPTKAKIQNFTGKLPNGLLEIWQIHGWGSYRDGLFWLVDPTAYGVVVEAWGIDPNRVTVFLRSSFGYLFFFGFKYCLSSSSTLWKNIRLGRQHR